MAVEIYGDVRHSMTNPDYLIIGTPSRGGELKVTFNLDDEVEKVQEKVRKGIAVRDMANALINPPTKEVKP